MTTVAPSPDQKSKLDRPHIWTVTVVNICNTRSPRQLNFVADWSFESGLAEGTRLITKNWPNKYPDHAGPWHPDYELVGLQRGMELDTDEECDG